MRLAAILAAGAMLLASLLPPFAPPALAHGPWPYECCHDRDCAEVDASAVREADGRVFITIQPGAHPMWPKDGRGPFTAAIDRAQLRKPVTGECGVCIGPSGGLLCVFPPAIGG